MSRKILFFIILFCAVEMSAQEFFVAEIPRKWVNYYIVELDADTAFVTFLDFHAFLDRPMEKLAKCNQKDTVFSNGQTKIVRKGGKSWLYLAKFKKPLRLTDYTKKQNKIADIKERYHFDQARENAFSNLNRTLGQFNYSSQSLHEVYRAIAPATPLDSVYLLYQNAADSILAKEKPKVDFFKSFQHEGKLNETEIISF